jgi:prepilin-type N-terminal cleavage/methylation domain-containing protein
MRIKKALAKNQSGFTLVEVMVTLVIVTMLVGVIGSFLVMHLKSYETTKSVIDIQYEAQLALSRLGKVAMESAGVYNVNSESNPTLIVFEYNDDYHDPNKKMIFYYDGNMVLFKTLNKETLDATDLSYDSDDLNSSWYVFANYVDSWTITPNAGVTFDESTGINITMNFKKNDAVITVSNSFKYRNKY